MSRRYRPAGVLRTENQRSQAHDRQERCCSDLGVLAHDGVATGRHEMAHRTEDLTRLAFGVGYLVSPGHLREGGHLV